MTPKISVLIPVYKVEQYIEQCLRSLLSNTIIQDCEVVIVDDCSPDKSMEVVRRVLEDFPALQDRVLLRSHDVNRGLLEGWIQGWLHVKLIRHSLLVENHIDWVEGLDMWEDMLLSAKVFAHARKIATVDKVLYHYRCNPQSIVNNVSQQRLEQIVGNVNELENLLAAKGMPQEMLALLPVLKVRVKASYVIFSQIKAVRRNNRSLYKEHDLELYHLPCSLLGKLHIFCYLHGLMGICDLFIFLRSLR